MGSLRDFLRLLVKRLNITTKSKEFETEGSFIRAENNLSIDASKILIQASADKYTTNSKNMGANFGITLMGIEGVSAGLNYGQMNSKGTLYNNAQIQAGNKLIVKADNMTIRGGKLKGKHTDVDVKKNLLIESLQDSEKMKQIGANLGYSFKKEKAQDGSLGLSLGGKDKKWVKEQSGIIGTENAKVSVGGTIKLIGSIIGGKNIELRTGKLEYSDIYDKDKGYDIGLNSKVTVSKNEDEWNISKTIGANFGARDKEQINRATIGSGTIIVGGKVVNPNINRDESIAQEITKNVNVDGISVEYKDNRRRWSDISDIMGEYGLSLGKDLDAATGNKYNLENRLGQGIYNTYRKIENFVDYKLYNKFIGIIPTKNIQGGLIGELQNPSSLLNRNLIPVILTYSGTGDDDNNFKIKTVVEDLTQEKYKEIKDKSPDEIPAINGVGNDVSDFADGRFAGTLTPDEHKRIKKGETIKKIGIFNPTNGLIADVAEAIIGQAGLISGGNWNGKQLHQIEKEYKGIFNNGMIAHSQGTIIYASKLRDDLETEEGKLKISKMKENYFLGIAVVPWILDDTINRMNALGTKAEKRRNNYDYVSIITLNLRANTTGTGHGVIGYNPYYFRWDNKLKKYRLKLNETGPLPIIKENEVINKVGVYQ
ncbi:hemagglutinin repeat-containing protein [Fusobacterium animalis]